MKRCPKCDIQFSDDFSFCGKCATKLEPIPDPTGAKPRKSGPDLRKKDTTSEAKKDASAGNSLLESARASYAAGQYTNCIRQLEKAKESGIIEARRMCGIFLDESEAFRKAYDDYLYSKTLKNVKKVTSPPPEQTAQSPAKTAGNAPRDKLSEDVFQKCVAAFKKGQYDAAFQLFRVAVESAEPDKNKNADANAGITKQGNPDELCRLGNSHFENMNYVEAVKCYRQAADQGHAEAQFLLGKCYYNGVGVIRNYEKAVKWYRKAAEQGNADAQNELGVRYNKGEGVRQNLFEAVKWFRKAAEQGNVDAQYNLGECCRCGEGVPVNTTEAAKWYRLAADQGDEDAQNALLKLGKYGW